VVPWAHTSKPKRHLDRFSRYYAVHPRDQHTHTDTHTTLRATSVAIGRIHAMHAMRPKTQQITVYLLVYAQMCIDQLHRKLAKGRVKAEARKTEGGSKGKCPPVLNEEEQCPSNFCSIVPCSLLRLPVIFVAGSLEGKGFPYSLPNGGPGADPGVQAASPQVT